MQSEGHTRAIPERAARPRHEGRGWMRVLALTAAVAVANAVNAAPPDRAEASTAKLATQVRALQSRLDKLESRVPPPELGSQMIELQIRHDRLWWAGKAGNWNLAYYMVGELGEALRGIEETNGEAAELQPLRLSEVMPSMMNPAIRNVQEALAKHDQAAFAEAYDGLSASCTGCHKVAGVGFLHIQRPQTPLLDNLRYAPLPKDPE